ncbi:hypothetical protein HYDPIDRAFT_122268 [Hydnomerulius pinastri MD-312]|nr:hypothetical protein HYDPIDRAFT_122268 [Hydnomerulius pinastri MD-312]
MLKLLLSFGLIARLVFAYPIVEVGFNDETIALVRARMLEIASASWELGTTAEALTELSWPTYSVFEASSIPPSAHEGQQYPWDVLAIAEKTVQEKPAASMTLVDNDGAVGDPASIGVAVLLANWTRNDTSDWSYGTAAYQELQYLLDYAPRTDTGAISHRTDQVQLWADFVYMAPPFIAYHGATQSGSDAANLLQVAYDQCQLYRDQLRDSNDLWRHVALGSWQDNTHWGTGNAWAAAGMLRVLEALRHSDLSGQFAGQQKDLTNWIQEILGTVWTYQQPSGTLLNTIDDVDSFPDSSSTALLASVTYRMAVLTNDFTHIDAANKALSLIEANVDSNGWLIDTVDPYTFNSPTKPGNHSPEGQAFVLLLHSAWRAYRTFISGQL